MTRRPHTSVLGAASVMLLACLALVACSGSTDHSPPSDREITAVLAQHGAALLGHRRAQFLAGVDGAGRATGFHTAQDEQFSNLVELPLQRWSYRLGPAVHAAQAQAVARRSFGPSARIVRISLTYRLRGVDQVPAEHDLWWTFVRHDGQVQAAADNGLATMGGRSWQGPWDFGPMAVARGVHSLVMGRADETPLLRSIATGVDAAVPAVTSVWGSDWSRDVAVVVPTTQPAQNAALNSTTTTDVSAAALAVNDGQDPLTGAVIEQRLVIEPATFAQLSTLGRRVTLTHEVTHIASARDTTGATPRWLVEGLAEYVGNLGTGQPVGAAAAELQRTVRRGVLPSTLPPDAAFDTGTAAQAYEQAWLACRLIARQAGQVALVRFYRDVGRSQQFGTAAVRPALRSVLHESLPRFVAQWRGYLRAQLG